MSREKIKKSPTVIDQADISAFVSLFQKIQPRPFLRKSDHRVCFAFDDDISPAITAFYQNVAMPIADYVKVLKHLRSAIFSLKGGVGHER